MKNLIKSKRIYFKTIAFLLPFFLLAIIAEAQLTNPLKQNSINDLLLAVVKVAVDIGWIAVIIAIIYSGFLFVTASGKEEQISKAKKGFFWVVVGAAVLLGAEVLGELIKTTINNIRSTS